MERTSRPPQVIRFGPFAVDLQTCELRENGLKVKLSGQPFQILSMLLERPGQVIPRETIRKTLWAADTFVDFNHSLNVAINKVRAALGDSAQNPRFVETLPRRGYRFIAAVDGPAGAQEKNASDERSTPQDAGRMSPRWPWPLAWVGAAAVAVAAFAHWLNRSVPPEG